MRSLSKVLYRIKDYPIPIVMGLAFGVSALGCRIPFLYDDFVKLMYARGHLINPLSMFDPCAFPPFRPVVHLFYQVNYRFFGITNYAGYHLSLALVHSLNAILVYLIASLLSRERRLGFVAGVLFAVFPTNLWSVWWISNAANALAVTLFLSCLYFFIRWTRERKKFFIAVTFILALLSFLAKMMAVTLPFVLAAYLLIYRDELSLSKHSRRVALTAMLIMTLLCYIIPRAIRAGSEIFRVDFASMYFKLTGEYGEEVQGIGRHILDNFLSYPSNLFMFNKFIHTAVPYQVNLICLLFFVYWLIRGTKLERFSAAWLFIVIFPYLFLRPAYFSDERHLYFPNIGLALLLASIILRMVERLAIKFDPYVPGRLTKIYLFTTLGLFFVLPTAIYGHDKYLSSLSMGKLEEKVHRSIYGDVPLAGKVVAINIPRSQAFNQIQLENMGRRDIRFDAFYTTDPNIFYLGDVYFIDYRSLQSGGTDGLSRYLHYEAETEKDISAVRFNLKIYNNINGINFNNGREGFYRLKAKERLTGLVAQNEGGKRRLVISCLGFPESWAGVFPMLVETGGSHQEILIREATDEEGITNFVAEVIFGNGLDKIEVINCSKNLDILISGIYLEDPGIPQADLLGTEYLKQLYKDEEQFLRFKAEDLEGWKLWQTTLRAKLREILGMPVEECSLEEKILGVEDKKDYIMERIVYQSEPGVSVYAYLLLPKGVKFPCPAVIALHGHGPGKDEVVGKVDCLRNSDFGLQLVKRGFVVLAPDARGFEERNAGNTEEKDATDIFFFGKTMMGMRVWDAMRAIDYLQTRAEVDPKRIGIVGLSMGGAVTLFTAALDERIKIAVVSGYFGTFKSYYMDFRETAPCMVIPGILKFAELYDIAGLVAPRPLVIEAGKEDPLIPTEAAYESFQNLKKIYSLAGAEDDLILDLFEGGHQFSGKKSYPWLEKTLYNAQEELDRAGGHS